MINLTSLPGNGVWGGVNTRIAVGYRTMSMASPAVAATGTESRLLSAHCSALASDSQSQWTLDRLMSDAAGDIGAWVRPTESNGS